MDHDLGYFDLETRVLEPLENPFAQKCYLSLRYVVSPMCPGRTAEITTARYAIRPCMLTLSSRIPS